MRYEYWLANAPGIGSQRAKNLVQFFGGAEDVYKAKENELKACHIISEKLQQQLIEYRRKWNLDKEVLKLETKKIGFVSIEDNRYPEQLKPLEQAPYGLYYKGKLPGKMNSAVAVVGARMCTPYGKTMAKEISKTLAQYQIPIISGMARGIDRFAHEGAFLGQGITYAVLGGGVDICYPAEHFELYEKIIETGGILSEYPPGLKPQPQFFPARNRIISGLAKTVIIIEAREKSGSLITADFALEQGRDVFAVPGRCTDPLSYGCNELIRQGAQIITSVYGLLEDLGISIKRGDNFQNEKQIPLEKEESLVYSCLGLEPKTIDELISGSGLKLLEIINILSKLKEKGLITEYYKNNYIKTT
ncbi:MAG: DNA-processing protein DprA [Lachnospiraceae bacterium]